MGLSTERLLLRNINATIPDPRTVVFDIKIHKHIPNTAHKLT